MRLIKLRGVRRVSGLHFTPDGGRLLAVGGFEAGSADDAVWVDPASGASALRVSLQAESYAVSADLKVLAIASAYPDYDTELTLAGLDPSDVDWHANGCRVLIPTGQTDAVVYGVGVSPDGKRVAASYSVADRRGNHSAFRTAVFPLGRGKPVEVIDRDSDEFAASVFAFSPDGKRLACDGGVDERAAVKVLNARTLAPVRTLFPKGSQTRQLLFSPDGRFLAVAQAKSVIFYPDDSDVPRLTLKHPKQVNSVAFTPDGRRLLSACHDELLRIWDTASGQLVTSYDWGIGQATAVAVSPDGLTAAAGGQKGQIALFDLDA